MVTEGQAVVRWQHDTTKAIAGLNKQITALQKQNQVLEEGLRKQREMNKQTDTAASGMEKYVRSALGMGTVLTLIGRVNQALQQQIQLRNQVSERSMGAELEAEYRLRQIGDQTPEQSIGAMRGMAERAAARTPLDFAQAKEAVFWGRSAQFSPKAIEEGLGVIPYVAGPGGTPSIFQAAQYITRNFGGGALGGTPASITSYLQAAAKESAVDIYQVGQGVIQAAQPIAAIGGTPQEMFAAYSVLASQMQAPEAGTALSRLAKLFRESTDPRIQRIIKSGGGLSGLIRFAGGQGEDYLMKMLGSDVRAFKTLGMLMNLEGGIDPESGTYNPGFNPMMRKMAWIEQVRGTEADPLYKALAAADMPGEWGRSALVASESEKRRAERNKFENQENLRKAMFGAFERTLIESGVASNEQWSVRNMARLREWFSGFITDQISPADYAQMLSNSFTGTMGIKDSELRDAFRENLRDIGVDFTGAGMNVDSEGQFQEGRGLFRGPQVKQIPIATRGLELKPVPDGVAREFDIQGRTQ